MRAAAHGGEPVHLGAALAQGFKAIAKTEGHAIEYTATWTSGAETLTFLSKPTAGAPQFRLIYKKVDAQTLTVAFEMAPPGQAGAFKPYVSGRLKRKG